MIRMHAVALFASLAVTAALAVTATLAAWKPLYELTAGSEVMFHPDKDLHEKPTFAEVPVYNYFDSQGHLEPTNGSFTITPGFRGRVVRPAPFKQGSDVEVMVLEGPHAGVRVPVARRYLRPLPPR